MASPYILTNSGIKFYYKHKNPSLIDPWSISLQDIAHSLARIARYNGHTEHPYSVAEHSVRMARQFIDEGRSTTVVRSALMHDATEAYIGDIPYPLKNTAVGHSFSRYEDKLWKVIASRFKLPKEIPLLVKQLDRTIVDWEIQTFMVEGNPTWSIDFAEEMFLELAHKLEIA